MLKPSRNALTCLAKRYRAVLRRCRLRALALACACALTALPPLPAGANSGGTEGTDYADRHAYIGSTTGSGGHVIIDSGFGACVYGGYTANGNATGNTASLTNGTVTGDVFGGYSENGNAHNNTAIISGGTVTRYVFGGFSGDGNANNNTVIISGGTVAGSVFGGQSWYGSATHNTVIISGGTMGDVLGGLGKNPTNNTVILSGAPTLNGSITGGLDAKGNLVASGNRLIVQTSGLTAPRIGGFEQYAFQLPADIQPGAVLLTLALAVEYQDVVHPPFRHEAGGFLPRAE